MRGQRARGVVGRREDGHLGGAGEHGDDGLQPLGEAGRVAVVSRRAYEYSNLHFWSWAGGEAEADSIHS